MRVPLSMFFAAFAATAAIFGGCSQTRPSGATAQENEPLLVPSAAMYQRPGMPLTSPLAVNILPASDGDYFFPRSERGADGSYSLGDVSAYTLYTMDAQNISNGPGGYGYQYHWVVQQGLANPPPP